MATTCYCSGCSSPMIVERDVPSLLYKCSRCQATGETRGRRRWFCSECKTSTCLQCVPHPTIHMELPTYKSEAAGGFDCKVYSYWDAKNNKNGPSTVYSAGKLWVDGYYVNGKRHGPCILHFDDGSSLSVVCKHFNIQGRCVYNFPPTSNREPEDFDGRNLELKNKNVNWVNPSHRAIVKEELLDMIANDKNVIKIDAVFNDVTNNTIIQKGCAVDCFVSVPSVPEVMFTLNEGNKFFFRSNVLPKAIREYAPGQIKLKAVLTYPEQQFIAEHPREIQTPVTSHEQYTIEIKLFPRGTQNQDPTSKTKLTCVGDKDPVRFSLTHGSPTYLVTLKDAFTMDGKPYHGPVQVTKMTITDPASIDSLQEFPTFAAKMNPDSNDDNIHLETFGAIQLKLETPNGQAIRGTTIVYFPADRVYKVMGLKPPTFPLWTLDGNSWLFLCESVYEKSSDCYFGEVKISGNSFVNLDKPIIGFIDIHSEIHVALKKDPKKTLPLIGHRVPLTIRQDGVGSLFRTTSSSDGSFAVSLLPNKSSVLFIMEFDGRSYHTTTSIEEQSMLGMGKKLIYTFDSVEVRTPMGKGKLVNLPTMGDDTWAVELEWGAIGYFLNGVELLSFH